MYLNPFFTQYYEPEEKRSINENSLFEYSTEILTSFINTSRSKRLRMFSRYENKNSVRSTSRSLPLISTQMGSFFGFLDEGFRRYDFYIGMLDAWQYLEELKKSASIKIDPVVRNNSRWYPFICLQSFIRTKKLTGRCDRFNQGEK